MQSDKYLKYQNNYNIFFFLFLVYGFSIKETLLSWIGLL